MILAAGRGERMRPLTDTCPKPLLSAAGETLIARHISRLQAAGFCDIVINHAHLGNMIEAALGDGAALGVSIRYSPEVDALETAGGIRNALPLLGCDPFLVVNGDIYCEFDLKRLRSLAGSTDGHRTLAHLVLVPNPEHHPEGDFSLQAERLQNNGANRLTYSGIGLYHPALFAEMESGLKAPLGPLLRRAISGGRVSGEIFDGYWLDVGTPERLEVLNRHLLRN